MTETKRSCVAQGLLALALTALALVGGGAVHAQSIVSLPVDATVPPGGNVVVPISVDPADGVVSLDLILGYDPTVVEATNVLTTAYTSDFALNFNLSNPGQLLISLFSATPLTGSGDVAWIVFRAVAPAGSGSDLTWTTADLNEGNIASTAEPGHIDIVNADSILSVPDCAATAPGTATWVPISATHADGYEGVDIELEYNPLIAQAQDVRIVDPLATGFSLFFNLGVTGTVTISLFGTQPMSGSGPIVEVEFLAVGGLGTQTPLDLTHGEVNEGAIFTTLDDGLFAVSTDADGDGVFAGCGDCDDDDSNSFPGAPEQCDGNDNDCAVEVSMLTLEPSKDNTLFQESGTISNGLGQHLFGGNNSGSWARRALLAFDVAGAVPAGASIVGATLTLGVSNLPFGNPDQEFSLHRLLADWGESTSDAAGPEGTGAPAAAGDATWTDRFFGGASWTSPGGDFVGGASASTTVGGLGSHAWSSASMVADVQAWLDDPVNNHGWIVVGNEASSQTARRFDSKDNPEPTVRPRLTIQYSAGGAIPGDELDDDGDGYVECPDWNDLQGDDPDVVGGGDCEDGEPANSPGGAEVCDGIDNDCDTDIDEEPDASTSCGVDLICSDGACVQAPDATVILEDGLTVPAGGDVVVPITVDPADGVVSMDFIFDFDPAVLEPVAVYTTSFTAGFSLNFNLGVPGSVLISLFNAQPLAGTGEVAWVVFRAIGPVGSGSDLMWDVHSLNEDLILSSSIDGRVDIVDAQSVLSVPDCASAPPGGMVWVPIIATPADGFEGVDLELAYDSTLIEAVDVRVADPIATGFSVFFNLSQPGLVTISLFGTQPLVGSGPIVEVLFAVTGGLGQQAPLDLRVGEVNEGAISTSLDDGQFVVSADEDDDGFTAACGDCDDTNDAVFPDAPELCDLLDNDCNGTVDDGFPDTDLDMIPDCLDPDDDNDGVLDDEDCAPLVNGISEAAGEVGETLRHGRDKPRLSWLNVEQAHVFNVYRGLIDPGTAWDYNHTCYEEESPDTESFDIDIPLAGTAFYYLVSATNSCFGEDGLGFDSAGGARPNDSPCPSLDVDSDNDGILDIDDNCPLADNGGQFDSDLDGAGDACDNCPTTFNPGQADFDEDAVGDLCDTCTDSDGDGLGDPGFPFNTCPEDDCPFDSGGSPDGDSDGVPDACDPCPDDPDNDVDSDGTCGDADNCPVDPNADQADADGDAQGDVCDDCTDTDGDGLGNSGFPANICSTDNCPGDFNLDQADTDGDAIGDVCDPCTDTDSDGAGDPGFPANTCPLDNCPDDFNVGQVDSDGDGEGNVCDACPGNPDPACVPCPEGSDPDGDGVCQEEVVLLEEDSAMVYLANSSDPAIGVSWVDPSFPVGPEWQAGIYGVGYETSTGAENLIQTSVPAGTLSIYTRADFVVTNPSELLTLLASADWDDGYVFWINGVEVYRSPQMPPAGDPLWNTEAIPHESSDAPSPNYGEPVDISSALGLIQSGANLAAVGVWNSGPTSSDLVLVPKLAYNISLDNCPDDPNPGQEDTDGDGIGDVCDTE